MLKGTRSQNIFILFTIGVSVVLLIIGVLHEVITGNVQAQVTKEDAATWGAANLQHSPTGVAKLSYDASAKALTVKIALIGLAPNSTHPAHIHLGACATSKTTDPVKYPLQNVVANTVGQGASTTVVRNVTSVPASGWYINVHNGPNLQPATQFTPIACGVISKSANGTLLAVPLGVTNFPNEDARGSSRLRIVNGKLILRLTAEGLAPNTTHAAHVHAGSCASTGKVLYDLSPLQADARGNASKIITFNDVSSIPASGWTINVHYTNDLSTQTGYNPILCGNVVRG
jgi:hypothetical protein